MRDIIGNCFIVFLIVIKLMLELTMTIEEIRIEVVNFMLVILFMFSQTSIISIIVKNHQVLINLM